MMKSTLPLFERHESEIVNLENNILEFIRKFKKPIGAREVAYHAGINERRARLLIKRLIERGKPIISFAGKGGGFLIATTPEQIDACCRRWRREAVSLLCRESRSRHSPALENMIGQLKIEFAAIADEACK